MKFGCKKHWLRIHKLSIFGICERCGENFGSHCLACSRSDTCPHTSQELEHKCKRGKPDYTYTNKD